MKHILNFVHKDMLRRSRSPVGVLILIAIPLILSFIFGLVFSPSSGSESLRFKLLLVDQDKSFVSQMFKGAFSSGDLAKMVDLREVDLRTGNQLMKDGKAAAMIVVPQNFFLNLMDGKEVTLQLVKNPSMEITPKIAQEIVETMTLVLDYGSKIFSGVFPEVKKSKQGNIFPEWEEWSDVSKKIHQRLSKIGKYIFPPVIELKKETENKNKTNPAINIFAFFLPGMLLMSMLFISDVAFRDLSTEKDEGQLKRIFVSPLKPSQVLIGKIMYSVVLVFSSFVIMGAFGVVAFKIIPRSPLLFIIGGLLASFACTGIIALIYGFSLDIKKSEALTSFLIIVMCMVGGSFIPISSLPDIFQTIAQVTVNFWSIKILQGTLMGNTKLSLIPFLLLGVYALVSIGIGAMLINKKIKKGVA